MKAKPAPKKNPLEQMQATGREELRKLALRVSTVSLVAPHINAFSRTAIQLSAETRAFSMDYSANRVAAMRGYLNSMSDMLHEVELIFAEPSSEVRQ